MNDILRDALWYYLEKVEGKTRSDIEATLPPRPKGTLANQSCRDAEAKTKKVAAQVPTLMTETKIVAFIQHHSVVAIPFLILFCKILVRWISREAAKDVFKSLLTLPLDFIYIALALVFSGLARKIPSLAARYGSDLQADFNLAVLVVMLIAAAVAVTAMDRYVRVLWQKFYSAVSMLRETPNGKNQLPLTTSDGQAITDENGRNLRIFGWLLLYWSALAPLIFLELLIGIIALGGILRRL